MRLIATMGTAALLMTATSMAQVSITEVRTGTGVEEYVELRGTPGASLEGLTLVVIGDGTTSGTTPTKSGVVEWLWKFAPSDVFGSNGFLVLRNPAMTTTVDQGATDLPWPSATGDTGFEGGQNSTFMLVSGYAGSDTFQGRAPNSGNGGQDLDTNDDGTLDVTPWSTVLDSVAVKISTGSAPASGEVFWYSTTTVGPFLDRELVTATTGTVVAGWDFQTANASGAVPILGVPSTQRVFTANFGAGFLYLDGTNGSSDWYSGSGTNLSTELDAFGGGAGSDGLSTVTSGLASLALVGGKSAADATTPTANGKSVVFKFSMAGAAGLNISYQTRTSGSSSANTSGFRTQAWSWSINGSDWTALETFVGPFPASFSPRAILSTNVFDGASQCYLRCTVDGATAASGNNRLDNVLLKTNPVQTSEIRTYNYMPNHVVRQQAGGWKIGGQAPANLLDTPGKVNAVIPTFACGDAGAGDCDVAHSNGGCSDQCCCETVCAADAFCCNVAWDEFCAQAAANCLGGGNCGGGECPADFNGDTSVDGQDLGLLLGAWGPGGATDLNGDGSVDGQDLGLLLGAWGPCAG